MSSGAHRAKAASFASRDQEARSISSDGGGMQYFSLRWNNHPVNLVSGFSGLYNSETLVDVTLAAEGRHLQAHKMLLSACSDYFQSLFSVNPCQHPIVILKDVNFEDLKTVVQFMYNGIVNVSSEKLPAVLKTADTLQIKGLGEKYSESVSSFIGSTQSTTSSVAAGGRSGFDVGSSGNSAKLLSVPSGESRQLSTESLPEYLHRGRDLSPRQASTESTRQCSLDSSGAAGVSVGVSVKRPPSPPCSPSIASSHFRKKFRRMSGAGSISSDRGYSMEEEKMVNVSSTVVAGKISPPAIHLSPSRQSSSSTDHEPKTNTTGVGTTVAKKKRELFSARSSRSGGSNQSSASDLSREHSFGSISKRLESSGSSGQSQSISQSQEEQSSTSGNPSSSVLMLGSNNPPPSSTQLLMVPTSCHSSRASLGRTQSAGSDVGGSSTDSRHEPSDGISGKRSGRFCLRRQDCLEKGEGPTDYVSPIPTIVRSSPNSPLMAAHYREGNITASPPPGSAAIQTPAPLEHLQVQIHANNMIKSECREQPESPPRAPHAHTTPILTKQRSNPLPGTDVGQPTAASLPPLLPKPPPYSPSHHPQSPASHVGQSIVPPAAYHSGLGSPSNSTQFTGRSTTPPTAHKLPSVRVIPDTETISTDYQSHHTNRNTTIAHIMEEEPLDLDPTSRSSPINASAIPEPNRLHPGSNSRPVYGISSADTYSQETGTLSTHICTEVNPVLPPDQLSPSGSTPPLSGPILSSSSQRSNRGSISNTGPNVGTSTSTSTIPTSTSRPLSTGLSSSSSPHAIAAPSSSLSVLSTHIPEQFGHCPKAREGPALGCNYCWNTTDVNGRILRRKTKYHCPDCQANLCIVPCFQAYHEQLDKGKASSVHPH